MKKSPRTIPAWTLSLIVLIAAGCASAPTTPPPDWNVDIERGPVTEPRELPALCAIPWDEQDVTCWNQLDAFDVVAEGNTDIAQANADALKAEQQATDAFIQAGQLQQQLTRFYLEQLEAEKTARNIDNWTYRVLIALGIIAAL